MPVVPLKVTYEKEGKSRTGEQLWPCCPQIGHVIVHNDDIYRVTAITHNTDNNEINILCTFIKNKSDL